MKRTLELTLRLKVVIALIFLFLIFQPWTSPVLDRVLLPVDGAVGLSDSAGWRSLLRQDEMAAFQGNECVWCHSRLSSPLKLTSRYAEWHISIHKGRGVSCDKCHGGNPGEQNQKKAHVGILPAANPSSRLHPDNLAQTCRECHQPYVAAFVESRHYQALKGTKLGPSCNTCHTHMASEVIYTPEQTAAMCSSCHDSASSSLPRTPSIGIEGAETMQAIRRASTMTAWADRLLEEAEKRKVALPAERQQMAKVRGQLSEAKAGFHSFVTAEVRRKADAAWEQGTHLKDGLRRKLYPNQ
jgi:ssDNA-binding Zn-finger/Zn-ribbon topoisomerase 1